jgi:methylated-DNA-[protein]-cysteine S-methyltransferase
MQIPMGEVTTYGQIAKSIARTRGLASISGQAVGRAVGQNPISILIPCHRVVGSDGNLTGYAGGLDKKAALLRIEELTTYKP